VNRTDDSPGGSATTDLYLVRLWKQRSPEGVVSFQGKLQHAVSGAVCRFDGLGEIPQALQKMMEEESAVPGIYTVRAGIQARAAVQDDVDSDAR
jgi:hypothetical protein